MTTWTSLRRTFLNVGRSGRSISRQVRIASSPGGAARRRRGGGGARPGGVRAPPPPGGAPLAAEERAGDLAHGVHPLLHVDGEREEVELLLGRLAGRGGRQKHGLVVEVRLDGTGGLTGQQTGLELDGPLAELAVVENGLDGRNDGFRHGRKPCPFSSRSDPAKRLQRTPLIGGESG